jgi:hypothetical protein
VLVQVTLAVSFAWHCSDLRKSIAQFFCVELSPHVHKWQFYADNFGLLEVAVSCQIGGVKKCRIPPIESATTSVVRLSQSKYYLFIKKCGASFVRARKPEN